MSTAVDTSEYELLPTAQPKEGETMNPRQVKSEFRNGDFIAQIGAWTAGLFTLLVTWYKMLSQEPSTMGWFAFHPTLQTLALAFVLYGVLTLQPTSQPKTKAAGLLRHQVALLFLAIPSLLFASFAVWQNKELKGYDHLVSWHGTLGSICVLWVLAQMGVGAASVWGDGVAFGGGAKAKAVWKYHRASGYALFLTFLFTIYLGGAWSNWANNTIGRTPRFIAFTVSPLLIAASVFTRIRFSKMKFF